MGKTKQKSPFTLEGRFLTFLVKDGYKIKALQLATAEGEYVIKLTKEARASIGRVLVPGDWIQVSGQTKVEVETGETQLKAFAIQPTAPNRATALPAAKPAQAKVLVCQKSACRKRGADGICQALRATLDDRGLTEQVTIKQTGCMDRCKAGPNVVVMPDKTRYSRVVPEEIPDLIEQHFGAASPKTAEPCPNSPQVQESRA